MERRRFVAQLCQLPIVGYVALALGESAHAEPWDGEDLQSFGYYQGLGPNERRSASRTDGTNYDMPCISVEDITAGDEKSYDFWHGHSRKHRFTVTAEHFTQIRDGREVELYTDVVDGHRHALRIKPGQVCTESC